MINTHEESRKDAWRCQLDPVAPGSQVLYVSKVRKEPKRSEGPNPDQVVLVMPPIQFTPKISDGNDNLLLRGLVFLAFLALFFFAVTSFYRDLGKQKEELTKTKLVRDDQRVCMAGAGALPELSPGYNVRRRLLSGACETVGRHICNGICAAILVKSTLVGFPIMVKPDILYDLVTNLIKLDGGDGMEKAKELALDVGNILEDDSIGDQLVEIGLAIIASDISKVAEQVIALINETAGLEEKGFSAEELAKLCGFDLKKKLVAFGKCVRDYNLGDLVDQASETWNYFRGRVCSTTGLCTAGYRRRLMPLLQRDLRLGAIARADKKSS